MDLFGAGLGGKAVGTVATFLWADFFVAVSVEGMSEVPSILGTRGKIEGEEQPRKRVKFAEDPVEELKWAYHVNPRIHMKVVSCEGDLSPSVPSFHPEFAHIFFGDDEQLSGYNEPTITLLFNAWSFKSYLHFSYQQKHQVLPAPDPIGLITPYLAPNSFTTSLEEFTSQLEADRAQSKPFGSFVSSYSLENRQKPGETEEFSIYFHQFGTSDDSFDEDFLAFHERAQAFILMEIDGGTYLEARDPRWEVFLLYQKVAGFHRLIGYCTAYRFYAFPDRFRLRISQFLLFPPFQKKGHGRRLLQGVYDSAIARGARDIPVEDPAPEFGRLRDMVDLMNLLEDKVFDPKEPYLSKETLNKVILTRRLWKRQVRRCFEIFRLAHITVNDVAEYRVYQIYVKKRLVAQNREQLELFEKGDERKAELHRIYEELEKEYFQIIDKIRLQRGAAA